MREWIEIIGEIDFIDEVQVLPRMREWIEILGQKIIYRLGAVLPRMREWIEILSLSLSSVPSLPFSLV